MLTQGAKILRLRLVGVKTLLKKDRGLAVLMGAVGAIVFLEGVLRQAVEGECGYGAFEPRSGQTPRAVRAAPAGEVVALDPDQAFTHISPAFCVRLEMGSAAAGGTHQCIERGR